LFAPLAGLPWAQWLDSSGMGRYDIVTALPRATLVCRGGETLIETADGRSEISRDDPFQCLRRHLGPPRPAADAPFAGGALGYFAYDLSRRLHPLPRTARDAETLPDMAVGIYDGALVVDHQARTCRIRAGDDAAGRDWVARFQAALAGEPAAAAFRLRAAVAIHPDRAGYGKAFERVQAYIRAGDCYQVNLALRFAAPCHGHPWPLYLALRERNPAPFSAWLNFPFGQVLSSSPERFLAVRDGWVETRPIKGTRPRSNDPGEDARQDRKSVV
jgi:para-aminobenzoate synthetase component 1